MSAEHMLWDLAQVLEIKNHWAEIRLSGDFPDDSFEDVQRMLFGSFETRVRRGVLYGGIILDYEDCKFSIVHEKPSYVKLHVSWNPLTKLAELRGGVADGMVTPLPKIGEPYQVAVSQVLKHEEILEIDKVDYQMDGWNPNTRRWIYRVK